MTILDSGRNPHQLVTSHHIARGEICGVRELIDGGYNYDVDRWPCPCPYVHPPVRQLIPSFRGRAGRQNRDRTGKYVYAF